MASFSPLLQETSLLMDQKQAASTLGEEELLPGNGRMDITLGSEDAWPW